MLKGEVFPTDDVDVAKLVDEFEERGFVIRYRASNGRRQIQIVSWHDYQRPDHREKDSELEPPEGWTEDKRGKWMCDKTREECSSREVRPTDCPGKTSSCSTNNAIVSGRDRSGTPVLRYSGDPDPPPPARDPSATATEPAKTAAPIARNRPRTADGLLFCLKVAMEREHPDRGFWNAGKFGAKDAREFLELFGDDLEAAMDTIEQRIELFVKDPSMSPWTVDKFARAYNGIGQPKRAGPTSTKPANPAIGHFKAQSEHPTVTGRLQLP
jgi:hypothetical protein